MTDENETPAAEPVEATAVNEPTEDVVTAKVAQLAVRVEELERENLALKATNYDLLMAVPATGEEVVDDPEPEPSALTIDDLYDD